MAEMSPPARRRDLVFNQIVDKEAEKLWAPRDTGLSVDGIGLCLDRAIADASQIGDVLRGISLDREKRHVTFGRRQFPIRKSFVEHIAKSRLRIAPLPQWPAVRLR